MKIVELQEKFSPKNFPGDINQGFTGAGERTDYVTGTHNNAGGGFPLMKDIDVVHALPGYERLEKGTKVYFVLPGQLVRGSEINAKPAKGVFAKIAVNSSDEADAVGYVLISNVQKPAGKKQSRVAMGATAQEKILEQLKKELGEENVELVSTAPVGSAKPDLVVRIGKGQYQFVQFEIKGTGGLKAPITVFDKSARRGQVPELLDKVAVAYTGGQAQDFTEMVDMYRAEDKTIGFPGDEGTGKSGKLPGALRTTDPEKLSNVRKVILDHFHESGDDYFAIYERESGDVHIFDTGRIMGPLDVADMPPFKKMVLATYGGPSAGAMRVGFKIVLDI